jgi:ribonuclease D
VPPAEPPLTDLQSLDGLLRCQAFLKDCTTAKVVTVDAETAEGEMGPELSLIQVRVGDRLIS